jgi:hypothetical protein
MGSVLIHLWMPRIAQKQLGAAFDANREAEAVWRELGNLPKLADTYEMRQFLYMIADELEEQLAASSELHRLGRATDNHSQANALFNDERCSPPARTFRGGAQRYKRGHGYHQNSANILYGSKANVIFGWISTLLPGIWIWLSTSRTRCTRSRID